MSGISTHVLDTAAGAPVPGIQVGLFRDGEELGSAITNQHGRCPALLAPDFELETGVYRIVFHIESKFPNSFYPAVEILFRIEDPTAHYHIPLLLSRFGYTTYRGN